MFSKKNNIRDGLSDSAEDREKLTNADYICSINFDGLEILTVALKCMLATVKPVLLYFIKCDTWNTAHHYIKECENFAWFLNRVYEKWTSTFSTYASVTHR